MEDIQDVSAKFRAYLSVNIPVVIGQKNYVPGGGLNGIDQWAYDVSLEDDTGNFTGSMITNFSERTKEALYFIVSPRTCVKHIKGEEKMNPGIDRPSWYEISDSFYSILIYGIEFWSR